MSRLSRLVFRWQFIFWLLATFNSRNFKHFWKKCFLPKGSNFGVIQITSNLTQSTEDLWGQNISELMFDMKQKRIILIRLSLLPTSCKFKFRYSDFRIFVIFNFCKYFFKRHSKCFWLAQHVLPITFLL